MGESNVARPWLTSRAASESAATTGVTIAGMSDKNAAAASLREAAVLLDGHGILRPHTTNYERYYVERPHVDQRLLVEAARRVFPGVLHVYPNVVEALNFDAVDFQGNGPVAAEVG